MHGAFRMLSKLEGYFAGHVVTCEAQSAAVAAGEVFLMLRDNDIQECGSHSGLWLLQNTDQLKKRLLIHGHAPRRLDTGDA